jgi:rhamnose transport system permease protein
VNATPRQLVAIVRWEVVLAFVLIADLFLNAALSPYFMDIWVWSDAMFYVTERAVVALPLALLIIAGEIDISVAGIIALSSVAMGLATAQGIGTPGLLAIGLATGLGAGAVNGALVTCLRVPSIVATIGTMSHYRGAAYALLGDRVLKDYPSSFAVLGRGYALGAISIELCIFAVLSVLAAIFLHGTRWGHSLFAMGANPIAARWSGIAVDRYRFVLFCASGLMSGLAAAMLTSRLGSTRPSIAQGWELEIVSIVVLGGVAITGGKGTIGGVVLAAMLLGFVSFGLSLLNVPGVVMWIVIGALLITVIAIPPLGQHWLQWRVRSVRGATS